MSLSAAQIDQFVERGFVRIERAFSPTLAADVCSLLWRQAHCRPDDPATWTRPVVRLPDCSAASAVQALNTPVLRQAYEQLVGEGAWIAPQALTDISIRLPGATKPGAWHVDVNFRDEDADPQDPYSWRVSVIPKNFALLLFVHLNDAGAADGPTYLRPGSHLSLARRLEPAGERGVCLSELVEAGFGEVADDEVVLTEGEAGTVYLCHPFLVHSAGAHTGSRPRIQATPPLAPCAPLRLNTPNGQCSPVERAIRLGLGHRPAS